MGIAGRAAAGHSGKGGSVLTIPGSVPDIPAKTRPIPCEVSRVVMTDSVIRRGQGPAAGYP